MTRIDAPVLSDYHLTFVIVSITTISIVYFIISIGSIITIACACLAEPKEREEKQGYRQRENANEKRGLPREFACVCVFVFLCVLMFVFVMHVKIDSCFHASIGLNNSDLTLLLHGSYTVLTRVMTLLIA
jgi:uncharacterized membrane protein YuzA (DUF378 family)